MRQICAKSHEFYFCLHPPTNQQQTYITGLQLPEKLDEGCETIRAVKCNELMQVHSFGQPIWPECFKTQWQHVQEFTHWRVLVLWHYSIRKDQHRGICLAGGTSPFTVELLAQSKSKQLCGGSAGRSSMPNSTPWWYFQWSKWPSGLSWSSYRPVFPKIVLFFSPAVLVKYESLLGHNLSCFLENLPIFQLFSSHSSHSYIVPVPIPLNSLCHTSWCHYCKITPVLLK